MSSSTSLPPAPSATYIPPSSASPFLRKIIITTLRARGFESAEAGAVAEMERLLLHHMEHTLQEARDYAHLCGRRAVHPHDIIRAQEESGRGVRGLRKETHRRRKPMGLETVPSPPVSPRSAMVMLPDLLRQESQGSGLMEDEDEKPSLANLEGRDGKGLERLGCAESWMPRLPEKWTYQLPSLDNPPLKSEHPQVSSSLLDFIKLTAAERGDIPPELGLVDYRRREGGMGPGAGKATKRKWGVKGVGQ